MSEVKRYRHFPAQYARMFIDTLPSGEYVTGADYDALAADNQRLREALEEIAANRSCGCTPVCECSESPVVLLVELEGRMDIARAALAGSKEGE